MTETLARPVAPAAEERARLKEGVHIERSSRRVRTYFGNKLIADSERVLLVYETKRPPASGFQLRMSGWSVWSSHSKRRTPFAGTFPKLDVRMDLSPPSLFTRCPYKGVARHMCEMGERYGSLRIRPGEHRRPVFICPVSRTQSGEMRQNISGKGQRCSV